MAFPKAKKFIPSNPKKYIGDVNSIILRSSWEVKFAKWCDINPSVIHWNSEQVLVEYFSKADNKMRTYYVDFIIKVKTSSGVETIMIEIKPYYQTIKPKKTGRKSTENYITECYNFQVNTDKWTYAREYAKARGWKFLVMDEYALGIKSQPYSKK